MHFCDFEAKTASELEDHAIESHEQCACVARKFKEPKSESIKTLENVPISDWILTPEEITNFGVDWKFHLEILKILKG